MLHAPGSTWRVFPLALLLLVLVGSSALAKPKVAVLGLEVTGTIDQASTTVARELTDGMRSRARSGTGPYQLAPNSDRELIDEKLINQCVDEAAACMSAIGREIGADVMIYGRVEKDGSGYKVTLHVLDVGKQAHQKELAVAVPANTAGEGMRAIATKAYAELAGGTPMGGRLVVKANVSTGTVLIDDQAKDTLADGTATIALPEGRYRLAIEADGYRRKEVSVMVTEGATVTESVELHARSGGGGGGFNVWKPVLGVTIAATVALSAYSYLEYRQMKDAAELAMPGGITDAACGDAGNTDESFRAACDHHSTHVTTAWAAVGAGVLTLGASYMVFFRGDDEASETMAARAGHSRGLAVAPVVTADGAGATMRLSW